MKETGPSYEQTFTCSDNRGQNVWSKIEKSSKIEQNNFFSILGQLFSKFIFWKGDWGLGYVCIQILGFLNISYFLTF